MAIEVARNYRLEVGTVLAALSTVTGISKASEAIVSGSGFAVVAGDFVMFGAIEGMPELSYVVARVKATPTPTATAFTLEGVNSTNFGTFVSGGFQRITTFATLATATSVDFGAGAVESLDATTLLDTTRQSIAGLLAQPDISVNLFTDAVSTVQDYIDATAQAGSIVPFRATKPSGARRLFSGIPSTIGESVNVNQIIGGSFTVIPRSNRTVKYST
jgi:hypothetical protein